MQRRPQERGVPSAMRSRPAERESASVMLTCFEKGKRKYKKKNFKKELIMLIVLFCCVA